MKNLTEQLDIFFNAYADRLNKALKEEHIDMNEAVNAFAEHIVESNPAGVLYAKNDDAFRAKIPEGYAFYKSIGITSMDILSKEITSLDEYHHMTKIHWKTNFIKQDQETGSITFPVIYFTWSKDQRHKIFSYITGDEQKALKEIGLI